MFICYALLLTFRGQLLVFRYLEARTDSEGMIPSHSVLFLLLALWHVEGGTPVPPAGCDSDRWK